MINISYTAVKKYLVITFASLAFFVFIFAGIGASHAAADSFMVTAIVPSPPPSQAPVITSPEDQTHTSISTISVIGTCSSDTAYISIYRNGSFAGTGNCDNGSFAIIISLTPGANTLVAHAYSSTGNEGPASSPVTVYYDVTSPAPIGTIPNPPDFAITFIETTPFSPSQASYSTSLRPTIRGVGPAGAEVNISYSPTDIICKTIINIHNQWSCTLAEPLVPGRHTFTATAQTETATFSFPAVTIVATEDQPGLLKLPPLPLIIDSPLHYAIRQPNETVTWPFLISGGELPYSITVDWDDGTIRHFSSNDHYHELDHVYTSPGSFTPIIKVTDAFGNFALLQVNMRVVATPSSITKPSTPGASAIILPIIVASSIAIVATMVAVAIVRPELLTRLLRIVFRK